MQQPAVDKRKYFQDFTCEILTSDLNNKDLIREFSSQKNNNTLVSYLKDEEQAWKEDLDGETRIYLVKDKAGVIALFFSLKCGLLVYEDVGYELSEEYQEFVNTVVEIKTNTKELNEEKREKALKNIYEAGFSMYDSYVDELFGIADSRISTKKEALAIGQEKNTINVPSCISAIELRHFCKNDNYVVPEEIDVPLGFGIFWEVIVPLITSITKQVGCKYMALRG